MSAIAGEVPAGRARDVLVAEYSSPSTHQTTRPNLLPRTGLLSVRGGCSVPAAPAAPRGTRRSPA